MEISISVKIQSSKLVSGVVHKDGGHTRYFWSSFFRTAELTVFFNLLIRDDL